MMGEHSEGMKRDCAEALLDLSTYIDGELTDDKREHIRTHLDDCPPCYDAYGFETELRTVISHRCQDQVPDELRRRIADAIAGLDPAAPTEG